ncbi:extracellular matrix protein 1 [Calypte anna]|uniref:extracellular matrix protein 1 n=1 Tax=Calypte anna TaxID=9244 RepID=UPI0011C3D86F|nr:extracellular matrix protein 1 [Calypte anna]
MTVVAAQGQQLVDQEPHVEQVLQEEQDPPVPPDVLEAAVAASSLSPSPPPRVWAASLDGFPPAWPVAAIVTRHCRDPPSSPEPPRALPPNAFAHLRRQEAALRELRPRLDRCCGNHSPVPCAQRAWTAVLDGFCTDEFGVKTRQFHCCHHRGAARRRCFARSARESSGGGSAGVVTPGPSSIVTSWDPWAALPSFPPGEPTRNNLGNICGLWGLRPGTPGPTGNLPGTLSHPRVRLSLRLEREFGRCCRNQSLPCAQQAWRRALDRFCRDVAGGPEEPHECCQLGGGRSRFRCFAAAAPHPHYDRELHNISLVRPKPKLLRTLCGPTRLIHPRPPIPELVGAVIRGCCPLPPHNQSACAQEELSQAITTLCATPEDSWRDPRGCCSWGGPARHRCFDTHYLGRVTLGAAIAPPHTDTDTPTPGGH